ncbi:type I DNA topoisomerase [Phocaeicola barnesiae]|uniref:type I DNA topoisomerase n=1 Tax=Phocaeicola barnesiae TaxID=376804 RepID=UPI0025A4BCC6|nr:type I DNA topoisomerase [Phocaeicola barnesiae]MDM8308901.1 type I DNA topoisomerase [Phocaeicola barnesiae]
MQNNLVIVESPAKAKTIEKFLGTGYKVLSSYGHIRDLKKRAFSIDIADNFKPIYEIPEDKKKVVEELKAEAKKADMVWLASDEDREGEAISWHLFEVLKLKPEKTKRIVFHEITKTAILKAIEHPRDINVDLVNAQQARRVLDRIVGFELSPVLWKKIKPALSAGRVQSVAVRLIVDREREIQGFVSEASFRVTAVFDDGNGNEVRAELNRRFKTKEEAKDFLEKCIGAEFKIEDITTRPVKKSPAAPFTTSTLQQEAARKLGYTVAQTMMLAQRLYENGLITYMRTDSVNLSELALGTSRETIVSLMGERYAKTRQYATKTKGAQEAHEAIRPTYMANQSVEGTSQEQRLYELIWKRTLASQMADAELEKTTATISISGVEDVFVAVGEVVTFDGFLRVYKESYDDDAEQESENRLLPQLVVGQQFTNREIQAVERYTQAPPRYTEASLVRKLEELGIGRPSTYAPTISTVQQRGYVEKGNREGVQRTYEVLKLTAGKIKESTRTEMTGSEKSKLLPTDVGTVVNDFLMEYFPAIMDYNFTANVEKEFDEVAEGEKPWTGLMEQFYQKFHPLVEQTLSVKSEHKVGERVLGIDPSSGKPVSVKIGRFGPMAQIGSAEDEEKPRFAQLNKEHSLETITLEEALELFKFPCALGDIDGKPVTVGKGKFGPYIRYENTYVSIPKTVDPLSVTLEEAEQMLKDKQEAEAKKVIKTFAENPDLQILNGRYGPYIAYQKKNYKIPENVEPADLNLDACFKVIELQKEKSETRKVIRSAKKKK